MLISESNISAFDAIWDIAVMVLVLRIALFYFGLTFITGCILGSIRLGVLVQLYNISSPAAKLFEMPFMLLAIAFWAQFIVVSYEIPGDAWLRFAIGFLAFIFMLATELIGRTMVYEEGSSKMDTMATGAFAISLVIFGIMPWLLMLIEQREPQHLGSWYNSKSALLNNTVSPIAKPQKME